MRLLAALAGAALFLIAYMYSVATRTPVVRQAHVAMPDWPNGAPPLRLVFLSDIHVGGPDMPPSRLTRIVNQINALGPDLVLIAGDFVTDKRLATRHYDARQGLQPLGQLRAGHGVVAVLGNHDHWRGRAEVVQGLAQARVRLLVNQAATIGPLRIAGVDDDFTGRAAVARTVAAMRTGPGSRVILSHSPDVVDEVPPEVTLLLAGHTHCGQIRLPFVGAISYMSEHGQRYGCGMVREGALRGITTAGLGTSVLPLRLGAVPELWLLTLGPAARTR